MGGDEREETESGTSSSDDFLRAVARAPKIEPQTQSPASEPPTRLGPFAILGKIGRGGMGVVFRARDEKLGRVVALKVLPENFADDAERRKRFFREARFAASINHPNVATVHEVGEVDGRIYIAMELIEGSTLREKLAAGPLPAAEAVRIARDVVRAVSRAHSGGIAHRDLKPDNIMLSTDGIVKVLDFGLAKPVEMVDSGEKVESVTWTQEGRIVGTPGYMSPEQGTGRKVDVRTDVFSLGVILYEMVTGVRPFKGETSMDVVIATSRDAHVRASTLVPALNARVADLIDRCLEKEPDARYANADALLAALDAIDVPRPQSTRTRWAIAATAGLVLVPASILALRLTQTAPATDVRPTARPEPAADAAVTAASATLAPSAAPAQPTAVVSEAASVPPPPARGRRGPSPQRSATPVAAQPPASASATISRGGVIENSPY
jgi:serine/threonine-protein kinase